MPHVKLCSHIKVTGVRCGSPALRGEEFCYFHQRMLRGIQTPPEARLHPVALIENEEAIQSSLMEVINAIARNSIDLRRADLILKALHIAVKNSRRIRFDLNTASMVQEVPNYPAPARAEISHVGTGTPARPSGPEVSGRSASAEAAPTPQLATTTDTKSATTGKGATSSRAVEKPESNAALAAEGATVDPTQRKPPASDKSAEILQARKKRAPSG